MVTPTISLMGLTECKSNTNGKPMSSSSAVVSIKMPEKKNKKKWKMVKGKKKGKK